ncbi:uncharacterized protein [Haliotis cracherodii]|uniref:uncharacterized protein n=1 Tax=Haliotis cracherodii TaxID=6455 RepID=UPI0039EA0844
MKLLERDGFDYLGTTIEVVLSCVICDTPARAFVKAVKGHSGYYGCDKCTQSGIYINKMTFPEINAALRTDIKFDEMRDEEHHAHGRSPFSRLSIGMVSQFPIDYMHLVCLGVMKKLLMLWMKGPVSLGCRIGSTAVNILSERLIEYSSYIPREFCRKGRSLHEIDRWKATEYRLFCLYTGPVALSEILSPHVYANFLLLFVGITCLASPQLVNNFCSYANEILCIFVQNFAQIYGNDMLVYNVHGLVHLSEDVKKFGPLDNYSAFVFESYLGKLKRLLRTPNRPLQQVIRRIYERQFIKRNNDSIIKTREPKYEHTHGPLLRDLDSVKQYKEIQMDDFLISCSRGNNCVKLDNDVVIIKNILLHSNQDISIIYEKFMDKSDFFTYPISSSIIGIHKVSRLTRHLFVGKLTLIKCKYVLLPKHDSFIAIPVMHSEK